MNILILLEEILKPQVKVVMQLCKNTPLKILDLLGVEMKKEAACLRTGSGFREHFCLKVITERPINVHFG